MSKRFLQRKSIDAQKNSFLNFKESLQKGRKMTSTTKEDKTKLVQFTIIVKTLGISAFVSFITFLMIQVIWADAIKSALPDVIETTSESMFWIQMLLLVGLFSALGISLVIFIIYGVQKDVTGERKDQAIQMVTSALSAALVAFFVLVMISFIAVFAYDPYIFEGLSIIEYLGVVFQVMADFVIYVYPNPSGFWIMSIAIYYAILSVFFVFRVSRSKRLDGKYRRKRADEIRRKISGLEPKKSAKRQTRKGAEVDISIFLK